MIINPTPNVCIYVCMYIYKGRLPGDAFREHGVVLDDPGPSYRHNKSDICMYVNVCM